jgi:glycosyltransferase involved in cell wall biosynthesis
MKQEGAQDNPRSIVGLFAWGDVWEDFYGTIGVSFEQFCESFTGSWQFGLVAALQEVGIDVVIYYSSGTVSDVIRVPHKPSGATICMMPTPTQYRKLYNRMVHPHHSLGYWGSLEGLFGDVGSKRILFEAARQIAPYLATPLGRFRAEIRRDGCRALICQDYEGPHFDQAAVMGKLMGLPVYGIFQGGVNEWNRIGRRLRPLTMKLATGFIIGPKAEIARVQSTYAIPQDRLHRIFNAIADDFWVETDKQQARRALGLAPGTVVVVWHGRVEIRPKGLDILLDAWERITKDRTANELCLILQGSGTDSEALRDRIEHLPNGSVVWLGEFVHDKSRIRQFLSAGDIYAFPSRREGIPVAPTEAMALGLPVVAAGASGVRDIFEDGERSGGVVVPVGNPSAFASALKRFIDDAGLRRTVGQCARQTAMCHFTANAIGRQLGAVLQLGSHRSTGGSQLN